MHIHDKPVKPINKIIAKRHTYVLTGAYVDYLRSDPFFNNI